MKWAVIETNDCNPNALQWVYGPFATQEEAQQYVQQNKIAGCSYLVRLYRFKTGNIS